MVRLVLAICPSNQDQNPVAGGGSEMDHVRNLAEAVLAEAQRYQAIQASLINASPQSLDAPRGSLSGLRAQQREAAAWIAATRQPGDLTVSLNLHSDSGAYRHCGYFYDSLSGQVSQWLGRALAEAVQGWFGSRITTADYSGYLFATMARSVACPVLLEMGAHTIPEDVVAVRDHAGEIAATLVATLAGFFGLETSPPLNISELRTYGEWALARCGAGEDPRDLGAFGRHLAAIGCDPGEPDRYGVPGLI